MWTLSSVHTEAKKVTDSDSVSHVRKQDLAVRYQDFVIYETSLCYKSTALDNR